MREYDFGKINRLGAVFCLKYWKPAFSGAFLLVLLSWAQACNKDVGTSIDEDPVFSIDFLLNSSASQLTAGLDGIYLFTDAFRGPDEVWQCWGSFAQASCLSADCPGAIRFTWRNNTVGDDFSTTWATGEYPFYRLGSNPDSTVYKTSFTYNYDTTFIPEVIWVIDDQLTFDGPNVSYDATGSQIDVRLSAHYPLDYHVAINQPFNTVTNSFCINGGLTAEMDQDSFFINFTAQADPPGAYNYLWNTGDTTATMQTDWSPDQTYSVTITDPNSNCYSMVSISNLPDTFLVFNSGQISGFAIPVSLSPFGGPIIDWIGPQEVRWSSELGLQPYPDNYFQVEEVEDYERNENNLPTKLMRVNWKCRLYNEAGEFIPMEGSGVIAVGWPG